MTSLGNNELNTYKIWNQHPLKFDLITEMHNKPSISNSSKPRWMLSILNTEMNVDSRHMVIFIRNLSLLSCAVS